MIIYCILSKHFSLNIFVGWSFTNFLSFFKGVYIQQVPTHFSQCTPYVHFAFPIICARTDLWLMLAIALPLSPSFLSNLQQLRRLIAVWKFSARGRWKRPTTADSLERIMPRPVARLPCNAVASCMWVSQAHSHLLMMNYGAGEKGRRRGKLTSMQPLECCLGLRKNDPSTRG